MEATEKRLEFVRMRADGKSYRAIAAALGIGRSTCGAWEKALHAEIAELKQEQLTELYEAYSMKKGARIKALGETLNKIESALAEVDFSTMPPERLLDFKLKYQAALKDEYTPAAAFFHKEGENAGARIIQALEDLLERVRTGEATDAQASKEASILASLLKAYDTEELQRKIDCIEASLNARG